MDAKVVTFFSYSKSEQAYHEEWASSGLISAMRQRRPSKVWTDRSLWGPRSPSLSSLPTTPARRQARPYWLSCTRLLPAATQVRCTTRLSVSGTEPPAESHHLRVQRHIRWSRTAHKQQVGKCVFKRNSNSKQPFLSILTNCSLKQYYCFTVQKELAILHCPSFSLFLSDFLWNCSMIPSLGKGPDPNNSSKPM